MKIDKRLKRYVCHCGQEYYSTHGTPHALLWSDGHKCNPIEEKDN